MSEDLIRRSDAIEAIELVDWYHQNRNKDMVSGANSREHQAWYKEQDIYKALEAVPSADRPQGEWAKRTHNTLIAQVNFAYCSECGQPIMHEHTRPLWNFCPNCGCAMTKE